VQVVAQSADRAAALLAVWQASQGKSGQRQKRETKQTRSERSAQENKNMVKGMHLLVKVLLF